MEPSKGTLFPKRVFLISGIWGLVILTPQLFMERRMNERYPPAITHPELFYGFIAIAIAWQILFLVISQDPVRYRLIMIPAILEKIGFGISCFALLLLRRLSLQVFVISAIDLVWAVLFIVAFLRTPKVHSQNWS